jgi:2-polyprenyl-3-methyl-5-hydroxy-6-metoxy-1,4-benzoquinol methylase
MSEVQMSEQHKIDHCILCGSRGLNNLFSLEDSPLANEFVNEHELNLPQQKYPLHLNVCESCGHVQLGHEISPERMFSKYSYVSGTAKSFVRHFHDSADYLTKRFDLQPGQFIVEIGSNDGTLLRRFLEHEMLVIGVDPASNIAAMANESGIPTKNDYFSRSVAEDIKSESGLADLILANNVLAHTTHLPDITLGIKSLLAPNGVLVFEVSYLLDVVGKLLFDTIYHEHVSYHSVQPLQSFFSQHGLEVFDVELINTHGGSIRVFVQHRSGPHPISASVQSQITKENQANLRSVNTFNVMKHKIDELGDRLLTLLKKIDAENQLICGFGAPAKATTLMHQFKLDASIIKYIVDDSPLKQGLFTPGLHIPVVSRDYFRVVPPSHVVIFAWNFAEHLVKDIKSQFTHNIICIVPLPELVSL